MPIMMYCVGSTPPKLHADEAMIPLTLHSITKCTLEYFTEGGANFIFRILPLPGGDLPESLEGRLLRVRKDLSHVPHAEDQLTFLNQHFFPLFPPDNILEHSLVHLSPEVPTRLNSMLSRLVRPGHRSADFLSPEETTAMLVTDMTPTAPGDTLLQLKPKWLTQSPNAPPNARRCRTCAIRAQRQAERIMPRHASGGGSVSISSISSLGHIRGGESISSSGGVAAQDLCPLDLVHADLAERRAAVYAVTADRRLREFLLGRAQPLLQALRARQMAFDAVGILATASIEQIQGLCRAMTLRDCTLYVRKRQTAAAGVVIDARLGDLDLKQPEKLLRWKAVERRLIDGGWYTNSEFEDRWARETKCVLSRCD